MFEVIGLAQCSVYGEKYSILSYRNVLAVMTNNRNAKSIGDFSIRSSSITYLERLVNWNACLPDVLRRSLRYLQGLECLIVVNCMDWHFGARYEAMLLGTPCRLASAPVTKSYSGHSIC